MDVPKYSLIEEKWFGFMYALKLSSLIQKVDENAVSALTSSPFYVFLAFWMDSKKAAFHYRASDLFLKSY